MVVSAEAMVIHHTHVIAQLAAPEKTVEQSQDLVKLHTQEV